MNIGLNLGVDIVTQYKMLGVFGEPSYCELYSSKFVQNFEGEKEYGGWSSNNDDTIIYNLWIDFIRRRD